MAKFPDGSFFVTDFADSVHYESAEISNDDHCSEAHITVLYTVRSNPPAYCSTCAGL